MPRDARKTGTAVAWALAALIAASAARGEAAADCGRRFVAGAYGVPAADPAVRSGALAVQGFGPIYLARKRVPEEQPGDCTYVGTSDVFRLAYENRAGSMLAGCYGDFDGDGRRDYALLMKKAGSSEVLPHVFLARSGRYRTFALGPVVDPYGYAQDPSLWPGPYCHKKPATGRFKGFEQETPAAGDVIQVGWYGFVWRPGSETFESIQIAD